MTLAFRLLDVLLRTSTLPGADARFTRVGGLTRLMGKFGRLDALPEHRPERLPPFAAAMFSRRTHAWLARVDLIGGLLQSTVRSVRPPTAVLPLAALRPRRLLVLESHVLGDLVMTVPLLERLRERYRDAEITLAAHAPAAELYGVRKLVDRVVSLRMPWQPGGGSWRGYGKLAGGIRELRRHRFDVALTPWGDVRDAMILRLIGADRRVGPIYGGGFFCLTDDVSLPIDASHLSDLRTAVLATLGEDIDRRPLSPPRLAIDAEAIDRDGVGEIVIHPGASRPEKEWPISACAAVARRLIATGSSVTLVGTIADQTRLEAIRSAVESDGAAPSPVRIVHPSLDQLARLLANAQVAVTMDSAASHLAAAVGTPVVVLFGPTSPRTVAREVRRRSGTFTLRTATWRASTPMSSCGP